MTTLPPITINQSNVGPQGRTFAAFTLSAGVAFMEARLTCDTWPTQPTTDTLSWRVDYLDVNGVWQQGSPQTVQLGTLNKDGGLPILGQGFSALTSSTQARVVASCTTQIKMGANITFATN